ncbi:hypothetical protein A4S06_10880 [Erysipelotrichaceae bacterium MTC7]|nr:hypothetical protein A4S06_10880 [Erysipelotrichaceae bacterium MTC7]
MSEMKLKRGLLVVVLCGLFLVCFSLLDDQYDPFARYKSYFTKENEAIIRETITDTNDIDYIVQQKIKPEQYMEFIQIPGFTVKNILCYEAAMREQPSDPTSIVNFVNTYRKDYSVAEFERLVTNYKYASLASYFDNGYLYFKDSNLLLDPAEPLLLLKDKNIVIDYAPKNLVGVDFSIIGSASIVPGEEQVHVREEVIEPLTTMMQEFTKVEPNNVGKLLLTSGYISYTNQIEFWKNAQIQHGTVDFKRYNDYPGQSENQLGFSITLKIVGKDKVEDIEASEEYKWLKENAYKYGFTFRYPLDKEQVTGKSYQPLTLRYVGKSNATELYNSKKVLEEIKPKEID